MKNKKSRLLNIICDFSQIICIEKFLELVSTVETLKFFLFDKLNRQNFENLANLHIYSDNFDFFKNKEELFQSRLEKLDNINFQKQIFSRIYSLLENY